MKNKTIAIFLITGITFSCSSGKKIMATEPSNDNAKTVPDTVIVLSPGDGKSFETAVLIKEKSETRGVRAEYQWISDHYKSYTVEKQSLNDRNEKFFDVITISFVDGSEMEIYFDITNFYGHF